jgi:toxin YoeB
MNLLWTELAWEEYLYWLNTDRKKLERINELIKDIMRSPFQGIGKPEPLKFDLAGKWSRKIDNEHRLVYDVQGKKEKNNNKIIDHQILTIYQCKYHY